MSRNPVVGTSADVAVRSPCATTVVDIPQVSDYVPATDRRNVGTDAEYVPRFDIVSEHRSRVG
jgi:hypothetical protein